MKTSKNSTSESQHSPQNKGIGINFDLHYNYQELLSNFMWITVGINNEMVCSQSKCVDCTILITYSPDR